MEDATKCVECNGTGVFDKIDLDEIPCPVCEGAGQYICEECGNPYDRVAVHGELSCLGCAWAAKH